MTKLEDWGADHPEWGIQASTAFDVFDDIRTGESNGDLQIYAANFINYMYDDDYLKNKKNKLIPDAQIGLAFEAYKRDESIRSAVKEGLRSWHEAAMISRLSPSHVLREMELERAQIMFNFKWKKQYIAVRLIQRRVTRAWIQDMRTRISLWVLNRSRTRCPFAATTCQRIYKERSSIAKQHEQLRLKHWNIHGLY